MLKGIPIRLPLTTDEHTSLFHLLILPCHQLLMKATLPATQSSETASAHDLLRNMERRDCTARGNYMKGEMPSAQKLEPASQIKRATKTFIHIYVSMYGSYRGLNVIVAYCTLYTLS